MGLILRARKHTMVGRLADRCKTWLTGRIIPLLFSGERAGELALHPITVRDIPEHLSIFAVALRSTCNNVESDFIQLGHDLQSLYSDAVALTQQTIKAIKLIGEESKEGVLTKMGTLGRESLDELQKCQSEVTTNLEHVNRVVEHLGTLYFMCAVVEKIALFLRVVGLSIGIESSRSETSKEMFSVLTQELRRLSDKVARIAVVIREDSKAAEMEQFSAHSTISQGIKRLHDLADDARKALKSAVREIEYLMGLSIEALERAGGHSRQISRQVGEIVVGIQLHDSMSQRIEHIVKALDNVQALCAGDGSDKETDGTQAERLSAAHAILSLQAAQLEQIITEVRGAYERSRLSFEEIGNEAGKLAHSVAGLSLQTQPSDTDEKTDSNSDQTAENPFAILQSAIEHLDQLLNRSYDLFGQTQTTAVHAFETAIRLSGNIGHVREINFETHLKALNAIVKAAHLGEEGKTLEVLAQEMKRVSDQSNVFASGVEEVLRLITDSAQALRSGTMKEMNGANPACRVRFSLRAGIQDISTAYDQFREDSSDVFRRADSLRGSISRSISDLSFLPDLAEELSVHLHRLEEAKAALTPWAAQESKDVITASDRLSERYTMQRERDIHEQVFEQSEDSIGELEGNPQLRALEEDKRSLSGKSTLTSTEALEEAKDEDKDDLEDNVELF